MALNLVAKLLLETKSFDNNLLKSSREIRELTLLGNKINGSFKSFGGTLLKMAGWAGAATTAFNVIKGAINASETSADNWQRTISGAKGAFNQFLVSLNSGDFSNFFSKMDEAITQSRELYDLFDRLGSILVNNSALIAVLENKLAELRLLLQSGKDVAAEIDSVTKTLAGLKNLEVVAGKRANAQGGINTLMQRGLSLGQATMVWMEIINQGLVAFDKYQKEYNELIKKGTKLETVTDSVVGSNGLLTYLTEKQIFSINRLTQAELKRYKMLLGTLEAEGLLGQYILGYAKSVLTSTTNLQLEYRYNRWANTSRNGGSGGGSGSTGTSSGTNKMGYNDLVQHNLELYNNQLINELLYLENMIDIERDYIKELQGVEKLTNELKEELKKANSRLEKWSNQLNMLNLSTDINDRLNRAGILLELGIIKIDDYNKEYESALTDAIEQLMKMDLANEEVITSLKKYKSQLDKVKLESINNAQPKLGFNDIDLRTKVGIDNFIRNATNAIEYSSFDLSKSLAFSNVRDKAETALNRAFGYITGMDLINEGNYIPNLVEKSAKLELSRWDKEYLTKHPLERQIEYLELVYDAANRDIVEFMNRAIDYPSMIESLTSNLGVDIGDLKGGDYKGIIDNILKLSGEGAISQGDVTLLTDWVTQLQIAADKVVLLTGEMGDIDGVLDKLNAKLERFEEISTITDSLSTSFNALSGALSDLSSWEGMDDDLKRSLQQFSTAMYLAAAMAAMAAQLIKCTNIWEYIAAIAVGTSAVISSAVAFHNASLKFANGGIVGGSSYSGDNVLVRANSGEMILNGALLANLFRMINNGSTDSGQVSFKIRGTELVGVLDNYNKKKSRI